MKFNGRNILISATAQIGLRVRIGDNVTIYDNVEIGDDTVICNDCVIGEPSSQYYSNPAYTNRRTTIGSNCLIRSHAIIYNGNAIASHVSTGHRIMLREGNSIGTHSRIGNFTELHGDAVVGRYCSLHSNVCVVEHARLGDFVWISPGTILTNDPTPPSTRWVSPVIGNYTFIAVNCMIMPGVEIGEHCLIGASSVVTRPVPSPSVA